MSLLLSSSRGVTIAIPGGRLDSNNAPQALQDIIDEIEKGETRIVIDFAKTRYISSAGLRVILKTLQLLRQRNGAIALCNANEQIQEVLEISNFLTMIDCHTSLEAAIQQVTCTVDATS